MNEHLERLLKHSPNPDLWLAVSEYRVADALTLLPSPLPANRPWWKLWNSSTPSVSSDPVQQVAFAMLSNAPGTSLLIPEMSLSTADKLFPEWMCFCCSVYYSGHFSEQLQILLRQTIRKLEDLADEVSEKAGNYPHNPINGAVWINGAVVRNWSDALSYLFDMQEKSHEKAAVLQAKCKITCSIMSHYHHLVGPDMIEAADALITINDTATAKQYYQAVIADFEPLLQLWQEPLETAIPEEGLISLKALMEAYNGFDRLESSQYYSNQRKTLAQLIQASAFFKL